MNFSPQRGVKGEPDWRYEDRSSNEAGAEKASQLPLTGSSGQSIANDFEIKSVRDNPDLIDHAANYLSSKWGIDRSVYMESLLDSIATENSVPRWFLMFRGAEIIGSYGIIENDFMVRKDLTPWLCALYVEESERCRGLGGRLLFHGLSEAAKLGFEKIYLCTDHTGYYERYGWRFFGMEESEFGGKTRVYEADTTEIICETERRTFAN